MEGHVWSLLDRLTIIDAIAADSAIVAADGPTDEVACGGFHAIVYTREGKIFSFGNGTYWQLGHGNKKSRMNPTMVESPLEGKIVIQVLCGFTHSMALASNFRLYSWGCGENEKLGHLIVLGDSFGQSVCCHGSFQTGGTDMDTITTSTTGSGT